MSPGFLAALPSAQLSTVAVPAAAPATVPGQSAQADLDKLRALVAGPGATPMAPVAGATPASPEIIGPVSMGDSILGNIVKFRSGYQDSLAGIESRLTSISAMDPAQIGSDLPEIIGLQIEVHKWSMSVMGVDNASKAGTNTVKELSHGG